MAIVFWPATMRSTGACVPLATWRSGSETEWYLSSGYTCSVYVVGDSAPVKPMR